MDATTLRWALGIVGLVILVGIYLYGVHQNRLRKRSALETFTREEIDSAFIEDEQLREELDNINLILDEPDDKLDFSEIKMNPAIESDLTPVHIPGPEPYIPVEIAEISPDQVIRYMLKNADHSLLSSDEIEEAAGQSELALDSDGFFIYEQDGEILFRVANLSEPGNFSSLGTMDFACLGFNFFIDLRESGSKRHGYEIMLKKIDELVRILQLKVYITPVQLLTLKDITDARQKLESTFETE